MTDTNINFFEILKSEISNLSLKNQWFEVIIKIAVQKFVTKIMDSIDWKEDWCEAEWENLFAADHADLYAVHRHTIDAQIAVMLEHDPDDDIDHHAQESEHYYRNLGV